VIVFVCVYFYFRNDRLELDGSGEEGNFENSEEDQGQATFLNSYHYPMFYIYMFYLKFLLICILFHITNGWRLCIVLLDANKL
jgi:succinate dehydrogenase/fumarate reductase cytochrome b subunit